MNSGGFWSLNFVLSYGILPLLILYTYEVFRHGISSRKQIYSLALVIYILFQNVSFAVMTCIVIVSLFLFFVIIFKFNFLKKIINWNVLFLVILIFFLISDIIYAFTKELVQNSNFKINNTVISSTSFSELGGILNILLGYYTWSIYTSWSPRSLLIFSSYLKNVVSWILLGMFTYMSYVVSISKKYHHFIKYILGIFVISLFFSKGPQPPFGFIFTFLLKTNSLFGAVRSPDNKFSALVILSIIVLIHYFWQVQKTKFLSRNIFIILAVLLIVLNIPILTKEAIIGKNIPNYSGTFIASIGKFNLQKISELIGSNSNVLMYPPIQFNTYISNSRELYIGQDILPNISKSSFIYYDDLIHLDPKYYSSLRRLYDENDFTEIANLDISHILIRKNLYEDSSLIKTYSIFEFERQLQNQQYQIIYNSPEYTLYNINSSFERKEIKTFSSTQNVANIFIFISFFFLIATIFFIAKYKSTVS
ncbi:MAG: hypothetical protein NTZ55_04895 [Candidatus Roizmanbacteria bacterium]|nr:hypothetical protein [Candidatus Roizmanbacteria bacterium]